MPGCVKETSPTMMTLKRGLRYHLTSVETFFAGLNSSETSLAGGEAFVCSVDMLGCFSSACRVNV